MTKSRNVPGQAGGYYLQETRFLHHLLKADFGDVIFLEYFGDVSTQHTDGTVITEEDKSSISDNPITDRSENLWKTLHNWILAVENGSLDVETTTFVFYIPHTKYSGVFIKKFHDARNEKEAAEALDFVRNELWGDSPTFELKERVSVTISAYVDKVFLNEMLSVRIISRFSFEQGDRAGYAELEKVIGNSVVPPEHAFDYQMHCLGWIKRQIDLLISAGEIARITRAEFLEESRKILRKFDREGILKSAATKPSDTEARGRVEKTPTYIRQLELIDAEYDEKLSAVCDYLMAEDDRYTWITNGSIHPQSVDDFENNLMRTWKNFQGEVSAIHAELTSVRRGAAVYFKCKQHSTTIEDNPLPDHLISGTYHSLAGKPVLGWHPNWESLLSDDKNGEDNVSTEK